MFEVLGTILRKPLENMQALLIILCRPLFFIHFIFLLHFLILNYHIITFSKSFFFDKMSVKPHKPGQVLGDKKT